MSTRGQGVVKIVDEVKTSSNANDYISSIDERFNKLIGQYGFTKKYFGKVVSVRSNQTYATVTLTGYDTTMEFLNKTGEMLSVGNYVKIECSGEDITSGFISEKFGVSNIENLNNLVTLDFSSLVGSLNSIFTYVNDSKKKLLAAAITQQGVPTSYTDSFEVMAENIKKIDVGDYFYFSSSTNMTIYIKNGYKGDGILQYKIENTYLWKNWNGATRITGKKIYFRVNGATKWGATGSSGYFVVSSSNYLSCGGDIATLIDYNKVKQKIQPGSDFQYIFYNLFKLKYVSKDLLKNILTLSENCFYSMFYGCSSLVTAPDLPATTLTKNCYRAMFNGCTSLCNPSDLPAMTLAENCYYNMFYGCKSLVSLPNLPATTLAEYCYYYMFAYCPVNDFILPATLVKKYSYNGMFFAANVKGIINIMAQNVEEYGCNYMFNGATISGNVILNQLQVIGKSGCASMFYNTQLTIAPELFAQTVEKQGCEYMFSKSTITYAKKNHCKTVGQRGFYHMYDEASSLISVEDLELVKILKQGCSYMFANCTSLKKAPNMSQIEWVGIAGCECMFRSCTSMTKAPDILPATEAEDGGEGTYRYMFSGCTSLTQAPLEIDCQDAGGQTFAGMFYNCSNLEIAPIIKCRSASFEEMGSYPGGSYAGMFSGCSKLKYIKIYYRGPLISRSGWLGNHYYFSGWVTGVPGSGDFYYYPRDASYIEYGTSAIPEGWTLHLFEPD